MNLLLVDDSEILIELLKDEIELEFDQINLFVAFHGQEAIEVCEKNKIDLIFTDCRMPVLDGVQFAKKIKDKKIPIYMMTGHADLYDEQTILETGIKKILNKPTPFEDLAEIIRQYL